MEDFLTGSLAKPENHSDSEGLEMASLTGLKKMFSFYQSFTRERVQPLETLGGCKHLSTGPLTELYTDGLDEDQIWEQIQLINGPVIKGLTPVVADLAVMLTERRFQLLLNSDKAHSGTKNKSKPPLSQLENNHKDFLSDNEDNEEMDSDIVVSEEEEGSKKERSKKVQVCGRKSIVDDQFFKISEMEKFLEMVEKEDEAQGGGM